MLQTTVVHREAEYVKENWVDRETGVNYIFHACGNAGGMTPLLDRDGKPVVSTVVN